VLERRGEPSCELHVLDRVAQVPADSARGVAAHTARSESWPIRRGSQRDPHSLASCRAEAAFAVR
jgi:hypothetical protein